MTAELQELYQQVILDHNRRPRNFRLLEGGRTAEGFNPLCGDHLTIYVKVDGNVIADVSFQGSGCAISKASASLMTESVKGKNVSEVVRLFERFQKMITAPADTPVEERREGVPGDRVQLGKLEALAGVRQFPIRVKCASLAWHALRAALDSRGEVVSTE